MRFDEYRSVNRNFAPCGAGFAHPGHPGSLPLGTAQPAALPLRRRGAPAPVRAPGVARGCRAELRHGKGAATLPGTIMEVDGMAPWMTISLSTIKWFFMVFRFHDCFRECQPPLAQRMYSSSKK